jgi:membrane protein YqaA with SNARE-associated domain
MDKSSDAPAAEAEVGLAERPALRLRDWFVPFFALAAVLVGVWYGYRDVSRAAGVAGFFAYMSGACTFLPLPTTWILLWAASPTDGLGLAPLAAATLGAVGTGIANMHDYYLVTFLNRFRPAKRIRTTRLYRRLAGWFNRAPFVTLAAASLLPIPVDFVRLLAISERYSRWKFALGSVAGRWPRYLLLAYLAKRFSMGWEWIVGVGGAAALLGLARGLPLAVRKLAPARPGAGAAEEGAES